MKRETGQFLSFAIIAAAPVAGRTQSVTPPAAASIERDSLFQSADAKVVQKVEDARWTGPIIAANAETLPSGHFYFEPYVFDFISQGSATPGSLSYLLYGVAPRFTAGLLPSFSYAKDDQGRRKLRVGDVKLVFQYRLTAANPSKRTPTIAIIVQPRLPTASFDRLKVTESAAGNGNYEAMVGLYGLQYFWMPSGRILRTRFNLTHTLESQARVHGRSVYGTPAEFRGTARPGASTLLVFSGEYSLTKQFVVALDVLSQWTGATVTRDRALPNPVNQIAAPSRQNFALVPAIEYNWTSNQGVIFGTRFAFKGHNSPSSITPVIAYSLFL